MMHVFMMHEPMMPISMILDHDTCVYDARACIYNSPSLTLIHVCMVHISTILDPDPYMYDVYIYEPRSSVRMHVCLRHLSLILDPDVCRFDECVCDAYIYALGSMTLIMMDMSMILDP